MSLSTSCQQHKLEPWAYLRDLFFVLPDWPAARVLELSPKYWRQTSEQPRIQQWLAANKLRKVSLATSHSEEAYHLGGSRPGPVDCARRPA